MLSLYNEMNVKQDGGLDGKDERLRESCFLMGEIVQELID